MTKLRSIIGDMELSFLGNGDSYNYLSGNNSAFFERDRNLFIFDMGQAIFAKILYLGLLDNIDNVVIFLTHLHLDHIGSLGEAITYFKVFDKNISFKIIYPDFSLLADALKLYPLEEKDVITSRQGDILGVSFLIKEARHISNSYCYFISYDSSRFYYSGDNSEPNQEALDMLKRGELDYFYQDVSISSSSYHIGYEELKSCIEKKYRIKVILMHLPSNFNKSKAKEDGFVVSSLYK